MLQLTCTYSSLHFTYMKLIDGWVNLLGEKVDLWGFIFYFFLFYILFIYKVFLLFKVSCCCICVVRSINQIPAQGQGPCKSGPPKSYQTSEERPEHSIVQTDHHKILPRTRRSALGKSAYQTWIWKLVQVPMESIQKCAAGPIRSRI